MYTAAIVSVDPVRTRRRRREALSSSSAPSQPRTPGTEPDEDAARR